MARSDSTAEMKSRLDQDYESDKEAKAAAAWVQAQPQAADAPKKAKETTTDVLAAHWLQALSESQATAQQILQD